jgi:hypothetical protein
MLLRVLTGADCIYPGVTRIWRGAGIMPINAGSVAAGNRGAVMTRMNGPSHT